MEAAKLFVISASQSEVCMPEWAKEGPSCPYGHVMKLPLAGFTVPSDPTALDLVACAYSSAPFVLTLAMLLFVLLGRKKQKTRKHQALWLVFVLCLSPLDPVFKWIFQEPRPHSCLKTCGMPSGHSTYAVGLFLVICLSDVLARPRRSRSLHCHPAWKVLGVVVLLPITYSRIYLGDHSLKQVLSGSLLGAVAALLWGACLQWIEVCIGKALDKVFGPIEDSQMDQNPLVTDPEAPASPATVASSTPAQDVTQPDVTVPNNKEGAPADSITSTATPSSYVTAASSALPTPSSSTTVPGTGANHG